MKTLRFLIISAVIALLGACSSSRKAAAPAVLAPLPADTAWHTLYAPVKVSVSSPMSLSASGRATLVRDSLIHISLRFFGMEIAQLRADRDSAWLVDKYHKIYTSLPLSKLTAASDMTLADVQELLLGRESLSDLLPEAAGRVSLETSDFISSPAGKVAALVQFTAKVKRRDITGAIRWDFDRARWNVPLDDSWDVPAAYRRIPPEELLISLKSL